MNRSAELYCFTVRSANVSMAGKTYAQCDWFDSWISSGCSYMVGITEWYYIEALALLFVILSLHGSWYETYSRLCHTKLYTGHATMSVKVSLLIFAWELTSTWKNSSGKLANPKLVITAGRLSKTLKTFVHIRRHKSPFQNSPQFIPRKIYCEPSVVKKFP